MRNFKKLASLLALALVVFSMLMFASCGGDNTDGSSSTSSSNEESTNSSVESSVPNESTTDSSSESDTTGSSENTGNSSTTESAKPGDENDEDNPNLVTVTVLNQLGKPVSGAIVQICSGEICFSKPIQTGADGKGSREYTLNGEILKAKIGSINGMDDFLASEEYVYFEEGSREITITIQKVTVNVFDGSSENNDVIEGAQVQLYQGEYALEGNLITDADGVVSGFVALTGGEFSAKVTKFFINANMYEVSEKAVAFGQGVFDGTIAVSQKIAYAVKLVDFMSGEPFAGVKVKLWLGNSFEDVATTDENGVVRFENVGDGEYSIEIVFDSPAYVAIGASEEDGRHYFADTKTLTIDVIEMSTIKYTVNVSNGIAGQTVVVYNIDNAEYGVFETDENGVVEFEVPHGNYTVVLATEDGKYAKPVSFIKGGKTTGTIEVTDKIAGSSKDAPIVLTLGEISYNFEAGKAVWFAIPNASGKCLKVGTEVNIEFDGIVEKADGYYYFTVEKGEMAVFSVKLDANAENVCVETRAPGTVDDPFEVSGNVECDTTIDKGTIVYYSYTADKDGTLTVTIDGDVIVLFDEFINGLNMDAGAYMYPVKAGQTVLVSLDGSNLTKGLDAVVGFSLEDKKLDYTIKVTIDGDAVADVVVVLYAKNGEELVEVASATTDEEGMCVLEQIAYASNYVLKAECPEGYTFVMEETELGLDIYGAYYLTKIKTGESDAPFEFDTTDERNETAVIAENDTVWYVVYVRPGMDSKFSIVANSANAVIKIYNADTNEDGIIDENDTPIATVTSVGDKATYTFGTNGMQYIIAVSTADGNAEEIQLEYVSNTLPAGSNEETAIEIEKSGVYTAKVNDTVYYAYFGNDNCKLTVALTGNATLKRVIRTNEGSIIEDVDGNTLTIENTNGDWIFFAISADEAGEYEFTVTIE